MQVQCVQVHVPVQVQALPLRDLRDRHDFGGRHDCDRWVVGWDDRGVRSGLWWKLESSSLCLVVENLHDDCYADEDDDSVLLVGGACQ